MKLFLTFAVLFAVAVIPIDRSLAQAGSFPVFTTEECAQHPSIIGFDQGKADIRSFATHRLNVLAKVFEADPGPVLLSGQVDAKEARTGGSLARLRLEAVVRELLSRGVPKSALWTRDDGHGNALVADQPENGDTQDRIVLITLPSEGTVCALKLRQERVEWVHRHCSGMVEQAGKSACDSAWATLAKR